MLTIDELAERAGVPVRTVRFYISQGLLPGPARRGRGAGYDEDHVLRLRLIRLLAARHVPLAEQRGRLQGLAAGEIRALLDEEERDSADNLSGRAYVSALLRSARQAESPRAATPTFGVSALSSAPDDGGAASSDEEVWTRHRLAEGVELHVRGALDPRARRLAERLLRAAGRKPGRE